MMDALGFTLTGGAFLIVAFLAVVAILWFLLPFAVFGVKDLMRMQLQKTERTRAALDETNALLKQLLDKLD